MPIHHTSTSFCHAITRCPSDVLTLRLSHHTIDLLCDHGCQQLNGIWHETLAHRAKFGSTCQTDCFLLPLVCHISAVFIRCRLQPLAEHHTLPKAPQMRPGGNTASIIDKVHPRMHAAQFGCVWASRHVVHAQMHPPLARHVGCTASALCTLLHCLRCRPPHQTPLPAAQPQLHQLRVAPIQPVASSQSCDPSLPLQRPCRLTHCEAAHPAMTPRAEAPLQHPARTGTVITQHRV